MTRGLVALAFMLAPLSAISGFSQITVSGTTDTYFSHNFNNPPGRISAARAFDTRDDKFRLNLAKVSVERATTPFGFRADIGLGDAMKAIHASEANRNGVYRHIEQAYVSAGHRGVRVDFGKFVTQHGAEVIETSDNWNYSRSLPTS
jgi:hypothetical protein